jgi:hypothetical protein
MISLRSIIFILIDSIPKIFKENRQFLAEALFKGHNLPTHRSCANMMGFQYIGTKLFLRQRSEKMAPAGQQAR